MSSSGVDEAEGLQAVNRSSVAALVFLFYDIVLTFDDEVNLIWSRPWSYTKFLFFYVRYMAAATQVSALFVTAEISPHFTYTQHQCLIWEVWQGVASMSLIMAVDVVLILRVHALYSGNPTITRLLLITYTLEIACMTISLVLSVPGVVYNDVCLVTWVPPAIFLWGAATISFQAILFTLTAYQFFVGLRLEGMGKTRLGWLLMRDGTWGFALIFLIMVLQGSLYLLQNKNYTGILYCWLITIESFAGYRILLNLQKLSPVNGGGASTDILPTDGRIEFSTHLRGGREEWETGSGFGLSGGESEGWGESESEFRVGRKVFGGTKASGSGSGANSTGISSAGEIEMNVVDRDGAG
ncbi:hypothetical protein JAAARDRAFT_37700 [Jaapia argillacea MUCL 33604]|uniref:DUF6533 domain-containing protein n=1 Tax=Jaapia argillacea MUCL 33604 TaxID=933084 RepID=A0A067PMZ0_9AGAM|nr:hypothetical protein JAAARDRAFT_37700 [Jaapia argillacea MUCL 33604]